MWAMSDEPVEDPVMSDDDVTTFWTCAIPEAGATFRVVRDEWDISTEPAARIIHEIDLVDR